MGGQKDTCGMKEEKSPLEEAPKEDGGRLWLYTFNPSALKVDAGGSLSALGKPRPTSQDLVSKKGLSGDMGVWEMKG